MKNTAAYLTVQKLWKTERFMNTAPDEHKDIIGFVLKFDPHPLGLVQ
jgi:hypothetical protein